MANYLFFYLKDITMLNYPNNLGLYVVYKTI